MVSSALLNRKNPLFACLCRLISLDNREGNGVCSQFVEERFFQVARKRDRSKVGVSKNKGGVSKNIVSKRRKTRGSFPPPLLIFCFLCGILEVLVDIIVFR